jgi:hypothetical protein
MTGNIVLKSCNVCNEEKPLSEFYPYKSPWDGKQMWTAKCKQCQTAYRRVRRAKEKDKHNEDTKRRRVDMKLRAIEYKGGKCLDCGEKFPHYVYDFHHVNPDEKEITPAKLFGRYWHNIVAELDKCVLLCANCHRIRHYSNETSISEAEGA